MARWAVFSAAGSPIAWYSAWADVGRSLIGVVGFLGAGGCVLATGFATSAWQAVALLCLAFLINDLAIPVLWAVAAEVGGQLAGTVAGVMNMAGGFGDILTPPLIPYVLNSLSETYSPDQGWRIIFVGLSGDWSSRQRRG